MVFFSFREETRDYFGLPIGRRVSIVAATSRVGVMGQLVSAKTLLIFQIKRYNVSPNLKMLNLKNIYNNNDHISTSGIQRIPSLNEKLVLT